MDTRPRPGLMLPLRGRTQGAAMNERMSAVEDVHGIRWTRCSLCVSPLPARRRALCSLVVGSDHEGQADRS